MSVILNALRTKEAAKTTSYTRRRPQEGFFIADDEPRTQTNAIRLAMLILALFAIMIFAAIGIFGLLFSTPAIEAPVQAKMPVLAVAKVEPSVTKDQAKAMLEDGRLEDALAAYEKLAKQFPEDAMILSDMGLIFMKQDRFLAADATLRDAIKIDDKCAECYNNLGLVATQRGRAVEAERHFTKAMDLKEDYADPYFNLAVLLEKNGDEAAAIAYFEDFLRHAPSKSSRIAQQVKKHLAQLKG